MSRPRLWVLCGCFFWACLGAAQGQGKKEVAEYCEVEVCYGNGSTVRMAITQEHLEVATRYGKLTVPCREIRRIEFGVHLPDGMDKAVGEALRQLGSDNFKARQSALQELVVLGPYSYPALNQAVKSTDPEVAQRAQDALKRIRAKVPAKDLRTQEDDLVFTPKFTIVGRVVSPTIKARAEYFGDLDLKLSQLRTMRWLKGSGETEVTVDASKYGSAANQWMEVDFSVDAGLALVVTASGQVDLWPQGPGQYVSNPRGYGNQRLPQGQAQVLPGTLLGRVGDNGSVFVIGDRYEGSPGRLGKLYLHIVPSPWNNPSSGSYQVKISSSRTVRASE